MIFPSSPSRRAFTLIELLVVIAIIGILMTMLFPAASSVFNNAKRTQAKNDATQLATAINAYFTEYGKMPPPVAGDADANDANTEALMKALCPDPTALPESNPRGIVFLEIPKAKNDGKNGLNKDGKYADPWGQPYFITIDGNYDNSVASPDGSAVRKTVIVWSKGDPKRTKEYNDPTKLIKSWE